MNKTSHPIYAVLTGDLIGSRDLSADQIQETFEGMKYFWSKFGARFQGQVVGELEVFRGDGWQVALQHPKHTLDAAVFLRAVVKACPASQQADTRVGMGIGPVDQLFPDRLGESQGAAFEASGDALGLVSDSKVCWKLSSESTAFSVVDALSLPALDVVVSRWSAAESIAVIGEILGWSQEETARHPWSLKKDGTSPTQQAIGDALRRIFWKSHIQLSLNQMQTYFEDLDASS